MMLTPDEARRIADVLLADDSALDEPTDLPPGGRLSPGRFGRYEIVRLIGLGGMGEVYEARQDAPSRRVALKVIRPELVSPELRRRFEYESSTLARLQHPGIAKVFDAGQAEAGEGGSAYGSMPYFAMEFVEGKPLTTFARDGNLDLRRRLELFLSVCEAVEHAHRSGIIHRDLKPGNILVDSEARPRILDFGMARATDSDVRSTTLHTEVGKLIGTLPYMSPEQVGGEVDSIDTRSDVYSLGVILYELLADRPPYDIKRGLIHEAARIIREEDPAPLSSISRTFRGDVETIVAKALEKEPARRYQSVGELAADIRRYLNDEPIVARRAGTWYQVRKFGRRNKTVVLATVAIMVTLIMGTLTAAWFAVSERQARRESELREQEAVKQEDIATATLLFMEDMLMAAAPVNLGRDVLVVEAVEHAVRQVDSQPPANDAVHASIRRSVGFALVHLGRFEEAERNLRLALELVTRDEDSSGQVAALVSRDLAGVLFQLGRPEEAVAMFEEVLATMQQSFDGDDEIILQVRNEVCLGLIDLGRFDEAKTRLDDLLQDCLNGLGEQHPITLSVRHNLAAILMQRGLIDEAIEAQTAILNTGDGSASHPIAQAASLQLLVDMHLNKGEAAEAEPLARRLVEERMRLQGPEHPQTMSAKLALASSLRHQSKPEAESVLLALLADIETFDAPPQFRIGALGLLATVLRAKGSADESEARYVEAFNLAAADGPITSGRVQTWYAEALHEWERHSEALVQGDQAFTTLLEALGPEDPRTRRAAAVLATICRSLGLDDRASELDILGIP